MDYASKSVILSVSEDSPVQEIHAVIPNECEESAVHPARRLRRVKQPQISRYARNDTIYGHLLDLVGEEGPHVPLPDT